MLPRAVLSAVWGGLWLLVCAGPRVAAAAPAPCSPGLTIDWTFRTESPLASKVAVREKRIFLSTHEGAIHALNERGHFLWTYTVDGGLRWGIDTDAQSRVYVGSSSGTSYALSQSGDLIWTSRSPYRPTGRAVYSSFGLLFTPIGRVLRAAPTPGSGAPWSVDMGAAITSGPVADAQGYVWLVTRDGQLHRVKNSFFHKHYPLPNNEPGLLVGVTPRVSVLQGSTLRILGIDGQVVHAVDNVRYASSGADLVVGTDNAISWLDPTDFSVSAKRTLDVTLSDAPLLSQRMAYLPTADGSVVVITEAGDVEFCRITSAPLFTPVYQAETGRLLVTAGDGVLAAIRARSRQP